MGTDLGEIDVADCPGMLNPNHLILTYACVQLLLARSNGVSVKLPVHAQALANASPGRKRLDSIIISLLCIWQSD